MEASLLIKLVGITDPWIPSLRQSCVVMTRSLRIERSDKKEAHTTSNTIRVEEFITEESSDLSMDLFMPECEV